MPENATNAKLKVARTSQKDIKMRGLEVFLDGKFLQDVGFGKEFELDIPTGDHVLKISNTVYSKTEEFHVGSGQSVAFEVANVLSGFGALMMSAIGIGPYKVSIRRLNP